MSDSTRVRLGGLWKNVSKGGVTYLSGKLGQARLLVFRNDEARGENAPHYTMYIVADERREDTRTTDAPAPSPSRTIPQPPEEDLPF